MFPNTSFRGPGKGWSRPNGGRHTSKTVPRAQPMNTALSSARSMPQRARNAGGAKPS